MLNPPLCRCLWLKSMKKRKSESCKIENQFYSRLGRYSTDQILRQASSSFIPPLNFGQAWVLSHWPILWQTRILSHWPIVTAGLGLIPLTFIYLLVSVRGIITTGKYLVSTSLSRISSKFRQRGASCRHQNFNFI